LPIALGNKLVAGLSEGDHLICRGKLRRGENTTLVSRILSQVLHFLLIVKHEPALGAEYLSV
jgi:hypothetical protein